MTGPKLPSIKALDTATGYPESDSQPNPAISIEIEGTQGKSFDVIQGAAHNYSMSEQCTQESIISSQHTFQLVAFHNGDDQRQAVKCDGRESCTEGRKQYQCKAEQPVTQIGDQKTVVSVYECYQNCSDQTELKINNERLLSIVQTYQAEYGDEPEYQVLLHCLRQKLDCDHDGFTISRLMSEHPLTTCICMLMLDHETFEFPQHKLLDTLVELTKSDLSLLEPWYKHPLFRNVLNCVNGIDSRLTKDPKQTIKLLAKIESKTASMTLHLGDNLSQDELAVRSAAYESELEKIYEVIDRDELELELKDYNSSRVINDGMKAIRIVRKRLEHEAKFMITFHLLMEVQNKHLTGKGMYLIGEFGHVAIKYLEKFGDKLDVKHYSILLNTIENAISQWRSEYADTFTRARYWMQQQLFDLKNDEPRSNYKAIKARCSKQLPTLTQDRVEFVSIFDSYRDSGIHDLAELHQHIFEFEQRMRRCSNAEERLSLVLENLNHFEIPFTGFIYALGDLSEIVSPDSQLKIIKAYNDLLYKYSLEEMAADNNFFTSFIKVIGVTEKFIHKNKTKDTAERSLMNQKMKNCLWHKDPAKTNGMLHQAVEISSEKVLNASFCAVGEEKGVIAKDEMFIGLSNEVAYMVKTKRYSQLSVKQKNDVKKLLIHTTSHLDKVTRSMFELLLTIDNEGYSSQSTKKLAEELLNTRLEDQLQSFWFGITAGLILLNRAEKIAKQLNFAPIYQSLFTSLITTCRRDVKSSNDDESYSQLESDAARAYPYSQCRLVDWHIKHPDSNDISRGTCYRYIMTPSLFTTDEKKLYQGIALIIGLGGDKDIERGQEKIKQVLVASTSCLLSARLLLTNEIMDGELLPENKEKLIGMFIRKYIKTEEQSRIAVSLLLSKEERKILLVLLKSAKDVRGENKKYRSIVLDSISKMDKAQLPAIDRKVKASTANPSKMLTTDKASKQVDIFLRLTEPATKLQINELVKALQTLSKIRTPVFPHFQLSRIPDVVKVILIRSDTISVLSTLISAIKDEEERIQILKEVLLNESNAEQIKLLGAQCFELINMLPASVIMSKESESTYLLVEILFQYIDTQYVQVLFESKNITSTEDLLASPDRISPTEFPDIFTRYFDRAGAKLEAIANKVWIDERCNDENLLTLSFSSFSSVTKQSGMSGEPANFTRNTLLIGRTQFSAQQKHKFFQQLTLEEKRSMLESHKDDFFLCAANKDSSSASNDSETLAAHILQKCKAISDITARKAESLVNKNPEFLKKKSFEYIYGLYQLYLEYKIKNPEYLVAILKSKAIQMTEKVWTGEDDYLYAECFLMAHEDST